ncbi:MAG: BLUF domain-containing protein [Pseudomonadota bacterium]
MSIRQLVYASHQTFPFDGLALVSLLYRARERNKQLRITGVLLHSQGMFVQCLEGESDEVEALFSRISADRRHGDVVLLQSVETGERHFSGWSMASARIQDFQALELVRAQWESEVRRIEGEETFSPGFVLMKSIWDTYRANADGDGNAV